MATIDATFFDIGRLDRLATQDTPIHRLDPRAKLLTTLVFVLCVVSFGKYEVSGLLPYAFYPVTLIAVGRLPVGYLLRKVLVVAPFAVMVGIFNPWIDRELLFHLGPLGITGGWVSFLSILLRFFLTIGTAFILIATTSFHGLCVALQRLGVPRVLTVQLLFVYRYLFVLGDEAVRLVRARALRSFGGRGLDMKVFGNMVGHLLLRTMDRAQRIHLAMLCRGFTGELHVSRTLKIGSPEVVYTLAWSTLFVALRLVNLPRVAGGLLTGMLG